MRLSRIRYVIAFFLITAHAVIVMELNFPGHLSVDSLAHLYEWHTKQQLSFNPVFVTLWVGITNSIWPEGGGAMLLALLMHCVAIGILIFAVPHFSWPALAVVFVWSIWPVMLLYDGIVWKDVIFANAAVLGASLAMFYHKRPERRWVALSVLLLAPFLILARQNGAAFALLLAASLAYLPGSNMRIWFVRSLVAFASMLVVSALVNLLADSVLRSASVSDAKPKGASVGFILLGIFDTAGILAFDTEADLNLPEFDKKTNELIASELRKTYNSSRLDTLEYMSIRDGKSVHLALSANHLNIIGAHPFAWVQHRAALFSQALGLTDQRLCMPSFAGVTPLSPERAARMPLSEPRSPWVQAVDKFFFDHLWGTPIMSTGLYLVIVVFIGLCVAFRGTGFDRPGRLTVALISLGTVLFCSSFFLIGISCDFRYTYLAVPMAFWLLIAISSQHRPSYQL